MPPGRLTLASDAQRAKAPVPTLDTVLGIAIDVRPVPLKA